MKKVLLILFILLFVLVAAAVAFLVTLDVDKYRPQIVSQMESALGRPVRLEKISLGWRRGLALSLEGLGIAESETTPQNLLTVRSAKAVLNLTPLLMRQIEISTIYLENPQIHLVRGPDGKIRGLKPAKARATPQTAAAAAAFTFGVDEIKVDNADIHFRDESVQPPSELAVYDLDMNFKHVALNQPVDLEARAAVFSKHQNVRVNGNLKFSPQDKSPLLSNLHAELNLSTLEAAELAKFIPSLAMENQPFSGQLVADVGSLRLDEEGVKNMTADMHLTDGKIRTKDLKDLENIGADFLAKSGMIRIQNLSADFAGAKITGRGSVNLKTPEPLIAFEAQLQNLSLEKISETRDSNAPQLKGNLSAAFQGTMAGKSGPVLARSLAGEGNVTLEHGVIENFNVLREVFRKLSLIPGLVETLMKRLPEDYQQKLRARDTVLETVQVPVVAKQGVVQLNPVEIRSDSFAIQGAGSIGILQQTVVGQAMLFIDRDLSLALIQSVQELQSLADRNGQLQIPFNVHGKIPDVALTPDLQTIGVRLAQATTQDVLGSLFKTPQPASTPSQPTASTPSKKFPKGSQILGQLLQSALQPQEDSSSTQQTS